MTDLSVVGKLVQSQPGLFDEIGEPALIDPVLVEAARQFSPVHTGRTTTKDEQRCVVAFALLAAGVSRRKIAERLGMSRHTLAAVEEAFEAGGKLAPLKERVRRQLALLVSEATEEARESIARGTREIEDSAWLKALATTLGIGFDKHQIATGGPTEIVAQVGPDPRGLVDAWFSKVVDAQVVPDSESGDGALSGNGLDGLHTGQDTPAPSATGALGPSVEPAPTAAPAAAPPGEAGGGDASAAAGGGVGDCSGRFANLSPVAPNP